MRVATLRIAVAVTGLAGAVAACSADNGSSRAVPAGPGQGNATGTAGNGSTVIQGNSGSGTTIGVGPGKGGNGSGADPSTPASCADAAKNRTYIGCDFWPTVTYNPVYTNFDFAAVVANGNATDAKVTVTRGSGQVAQVTVRAGTLEVIKLPWVNELHGPTFDAATTGGRIHASVRVDGGAYHLVSDTPVTVWQFNPLQYEKPRSECQYQESFTTKCLAVSNDASLLLPSTAMTGNYRLFGRSAKNGGDTYGSTPGAYAITATADGTSVVVQLSAAIEAGTGVTAAVKGDQVTYTMNAGDVIQLLGKWGAFWDDPHADLSGSLINATKPVQVISLNPLCNVPDENTGYADHLEEIVLPAEVIGKRYLVAAPSVPGLIPADGGTAHPLVGHLVRFYGSEDGTTLTYTGTKPAGAPSTLSAGQVVEVTRATDAFEVTADKPFAVASFMLGAMLQDPTSAQDVQLGDPAMTMLVTPEQFRQTYSFLAPTDYVESYADVFVPDGANVQLDGAALVGSPSAIGTSGYSVVRAKLSADGGGIHRIEADKPVGLQVECFGHATGVYYPGGLNLTLISKAPVIVIK